MTHHVYWSPRAEEQLRELFISRGETPAAAKLVQAIVKRTFVLHDHPQIGRVVPEHGHKQLRELIERNHRIFYRIHVDGIEVVTVFNAAMSYDPNDVE